MGTPPAPPANLPAPPALDTGGFGGYVVPPEVQGRILSMLVDAAPFANSLTRLPVSSSAVVFPTAAPSGAAWVPELGRIPLMTLADDAYVVAVAKLAGLLDVSNETISDAESNVTTQLQTLLRDSLAPQLDQGLLVGDGPPEPEGVIANAPAAAGATLLAAVAAAKGAIGDSGGVANTLAMSGTAMAEADATTDDQGAMIFPGGFGEAVGLAPVVVPGLDTPLVYDSARIYAVVNGALSEVAITDAFRWDFDATTFRVKARVACACPVPDKTIRKLTIAGTQSASAQSASARSAKPGGGKAA